MWMEELVCGKARGEREHGELHVTSVPAREGEGKQQEGKRGESSCVAGGGGRRGGGHCAACCHTQNSQSKRSSAAAGGGRVVLFTNDFHSVTLFHCGYHMAWQRPQERPGRCRHVPYIPHTHTQRPAPSTGCLHAANVCRFQKSGTSGERFRVSRAHTYTHTKEEEKEQGSRNRKTSMDARSSRRARPTTSLSAHQTGTTAHQARSLKDGSRRDGAASHTRRREGGAGTCAGHERPTRAQRHSRTGAQVRAVTTALPVPPQRNGTGKRKRGWTTKPANGAR